jgi:hypothetical protein
MISINKLLLRVVLACAVAAIPALAQGKKAKAGDAKAADTKTVNGKTYKKVESKAAPSSPVDINSASQAALESLPGIGPATAKKIITGRPYSSAGDLAKAGVPAKTIQQITPMITVGSALPGSAGAASATSGRKSKAAAGSANSTPATPVTSTPGATPPAAATKSAAAKANSAAAASYTPPPSPGMVWINPDTKVYHKEGDRWYGKTKNGKYMSLADAEKAGYRPAKK